MFIFYCLHKADDQITYSNGYNRRNKTRNLKGVIDYILPNSGRSGSIKVDGCDHRRVVWQKEVTINRRKHGE